MKFGQKIASTYYKSKNEETYAVITEFRPVRTYIICLILLLFNIKALNIISISIFPVMIFTFELILT